jgi:hypothetical protein
MNRSLLLTAALMCSFVLALGACKSGDDDDDSTAGTGGTTATGTGGTAAATGGMTGGAAGTTAGAGGMAAGGMAPGDMPNATCLMATPGMACDRCACTPNAMNGCLEELTACEGGADMMGNMLCKAIIDCANKNKCSGQACTTPCMTEISAAISYMGTAMPAPLAGAMAVGACTSMRCKGACP